MPPLTEKIARNIGILRRTLKPTFYSPNTSTVKYIVQWIDKGITFDEEYDTREEADLVVANLLAEGIKAVISKHTITPKGEWIERLSSSSSSFAEATPKIARKVFTDLLFDEEKANVDYTHLSANPVFSDAQRQLILGIATDEMRHHRILADILHVLDGEEKIV